MADIDEVKLGKRKEREDVSEDKSQGATLFVSNLPYNATSTDLKTLFSDLAPVRSAFVVTEGGTSKGVGYVSFAIKEDATAALQSIEKDGIALNGRALRVQWPESKRKAKGEIRERKPAPAPKAVPVSKTEKDPNAIRTIVISGLAQSVDQKSLWKKVKKYDGAESVELSKDESAVAFALFSTPAHAMHAVEKLHAHIFKGSLLSVTLKKRVENLLKTVTDKQSQSTAGNKNVAPSRGNRLIIRNLPWDVTEKDLRALFLPYGPIHSVHIPPPVVEEDGKKAKARGFAFIWYLSKKDAERAIDGVNGREVIPGAITAPTMNKKERARLRRKLRKQAEGEEGENANAEEDVEEEDDKKEESSKVSGKGRIVAVDWALSKDRYEEAKTIDAGEETSDEEVSNVEDADSDEDKESDEHGSENESEASGVEDEENDEIASSENEMDVDEHSDNEESGKPTLPPPEVGTTLFVRNVPFDATEDEIRILFKAFGPLRYARVTMDEATGRSRGTAFVCFWNKEDADKAIHQSEILSREVGLEGPRKNPFSMPSILTPDPSSSLAQSLVLHGRTLDIARAVTREQAQKLKDEGERMREKADKRNLYLLREGVIFPNSPASATLSAAELEKRTASFNTRRALLKSNPLLYVSKTRLSIRQIPVFATDRSLKRLGIHAVRAFEEEVKAGSRQPLSEEEIRDLSIQPPVLGDGGSDSEEKEVKPEKKRKPKKFGRDTKVKQAKIVRQSDRVDPITGKGKSKGYGFLEMTTHADALRVLRWANNNPAIGELMEAWYKEELSELVKKMQGEKAGKGKSDNEKKEDEDETQFAARLNRAKSELEQLERLEGKKSKKTLIVEFSIENTQVVNRRKMVQKDGLERKGHPKSGQERRVEDEHDEKPSKRQKTDPSVRNSNTKSMSRTRPFNDSPKDSKKSGVGAIIGRKRRERKTKGK